MYMNDFTLSQFACSYQHNSMIFNWRNCRKQRFVFHCLQCDQITLHTFNQFFFIINFCFWAKSNDAPPALCQTNEQTHNREGEKDDSSLGKKIKDKRGLVCPTGCKAGLGYHFNFPLCSFGVVEFGCRWNPCLIVEGAEKE